MKLREIMSTPCESVDSGASMQDAARKMKERNVGMLPVMSGERCIGVVTDRDLVVRGLSEGSTDRSLTELMSPNPVCMDQDSDVKDAIRQMERSAVGRVVVTDGGEKPIGVVSAGAIALAMQGPQVHELARDLSAAHSKGTN